MVSAPLLYACILTLRMLQHQKRVVLSLPSFFSTSCFMPAQPGITTVRHKNLSQASGLPLGAHTTHTYFPHTTSVSLHTHTAQAKMLGNTLRSAAASSCGGAQAPLGMLFSSLRGISSSVCAQSGAATDKDALVAPIHLDTCICPCSAPRLPRCRTLHIQLPCIHTAPGASSPHIDAAHTKTHKQISLYCCCCCSGCHPNHSVCLHPVLTLATHSLFCTDALQARLHTRTRLQVRVGGNAAVC